MEQRVCNHSWSTELKTHSLDLEHEMCMVYGVSGIRHNIQTKYLILIINNERHTQKDWDTENSFFISSSNSVLVYS